MKALVLIALVLVVPSAASALAQLPPWLVTPTSGSGEQAAARLLTRPPLERATGSLRAQGIDNSYVTETKWKSEWGSFDRDYVRQRHVEVRVFAWGRGDNKAELEWIWFGRTLGENTTRVILKRERMPIELHGGAGFKIIVLHSGLVLGSEQRYVLANEHYTSGHKIEGWYVRLLIDGATVSDASSDQHLIDLSRDTQRLARLQNIAVPSTSQPTPPHIRPGIEGLGNSKTFPPQHHD